MLQEILDLGFDCVELGHGTRLSLMSSIQKTFDAGKVRFSSLHNFCPLPLEYTRSAPDAFEFSSPSESERERAVRLSCQTIDFAARLGAPNVVLHLGSVRMASASDKLQAMVKAGHIHSRRYVQTKLDAVKRRSIKAPPQLQHSKDCLKRILEHAGQKNIRLGIEGRLRYEEIPSENEVLDFLKEFDSPLVGYWHDFGHIQVKENLSFLDHRQWLEKIASRLIGCHLHDVIWPERDHQPPFSGSIQYDQLIPLLAKETLLVWEMHPTVSAEQLAQSLQRWRKQFPA